ncbi:MAG: hypothetical protein OXR84_15070 [Magnetovibrio sp.]|nr:hypothetical protein [Magnetovibrio sp.]
MYTRENPSPRYAELIGVYRQAHVEGIPHCGNAPEQAFPGKVRVQHVSRISFLTKLYGVESLLDYGSGKGDQYRTEPGGTDLKTVYGVDEIVCYDPGYQPFSQLPDRRFGGVLCIDVMEHCPKDGLPWIVDEIFGYAEHFVYMTVACFSASKTLPNGENAHCTVEDPDWWRALLSETGARYPSVTAEVVFLELDFEREIITEAVSRFND